MFRYHSIQVDGGPIRANKSYWKRIFIDSIIAWGVGEEKGK